MARDNILKLVDLNDYIKASEVCVKPLIKSRPAHKEEDNYKETIAISLKDCLACKGCVTSAETVLIEKQNTLELIKNLNEKEFTVVTIVSPQSIASISVKFSWTYELTIHFVKSVLKKVLKSMYVIDMVNSEKIVLQKSLEEFNDVYRKGSENLPLLSSACPGVVCLIEKKHPDFVNNISRIRSPMTLYSNIVRNCLQNSKSSENKPIYIIAIMPCFDKKLEASRPQFAYQTIDEEKKEVDMVLTTSELIEIVENNIESFIPIKLEIFDDPFSFNINCTVSVSEGSSSGGYTDQIFCYASKKLFNVDINLKDNVPSLSQIEPLDSQIYSVEVYDLNSPDFVILELNINNKNDNIKQNLLKFAKVNGLRNIQNLLRKLKNPKHGFSYIEIMACPTGCLNGGGQFQKIGDLRSVKDSLLSIEKVYNKLEKSNMFNLNTAILDNNDNIKYTTEYVKFTNQNQPIHSLISW